MIQTENTPNPNAVKFHFRKKNISEIGAKEFQKKYIKKVKIILLKIYLEF